MDRKGSTSIFAIGTIVLALVIATVFVVVGVYVADEFEQEFDTGSYAENAAVDGLDALSDLSGWLPLIAIISIAIVILGLIMGVGAFRGRGR